MSRSHSLKGFERFGSLRAEDADVSSWASLLGSMADLVGVAPRYPGQPRKEGIPEEQGLQPSDSELIRG